MVVPVPWVGLVVAGMMLAVTVLTAIPARIAARRPAAEALQAESA